MENTTMKLIHPNFYLGSQEYFIKFQNGRHHIKEVTPDYMPEHIIVFSGTYEQCLTERDKMDVEYRESLF